ncbi:TonB-dependent receptor domain-containing protein [Marinifilum sp. D714]|uniref:TonB-dependent receptor domain-containing protein n=1 Tax=Marinifilum sp. D714 TaxID=2937523 RepID=UPI0027C2E7C6|nr:TonB-dependent receptor [Marinifilum sp. D714]MDQ2180658.1 TonB-dependent receptor [Marinifilum sp. D714]
MNCYHLINLKSFLLLAFILLVCEVYATERKQKMHGVVCDQKDKSPIAFATVSLHQQRDTSLITGTTSNQDGYFEIDQVKNGSYLLRISFIGYQTYMLPVRLDKNHNFNLGTVSLHEETIHMAETVVVGERIKAKTIDNGTSFLMNKKIYSNSNSGVDILKHVPGVQIDLMKNISLDGSSNIKILVDGKERDKQYLEQLNAKQIDRVEIIRDPGANYDASITGVIHVILKERELGMSGHIFSEIPTNSKEIFLDPTFGLNYNNRKLNLYTSYNGNLRYFDNTEENIKILNTPNGLHTFYSAMDLRQKNWKHNIHMGADYYLDSRNQFSLYAFLCPENQSFEGRSEMQGSTNEKINLQETSARIEKNDYILSHYSMYYKHLFNRKGREIAFDLNYFRLRGEHSIWYENQENTELNGIKPQNQFVGFRMDYTSPVGSDLKLDAGWKSQLRKMEDRNSTDFNYQEDIHAAYMALSGKKNKIKASIGLRGEYSYSGLNVGEKNEEISFLPNLQLTWQVSKKQRFRFNYRKSITRPHVYQLSPIATRIDPVSIKRGNPDLIPAIHHHIGLNYSGAIGKSYVSVQMYHSISNDLIQNYAFVNQEQLLENNIANLADRKEYGLKLSATLSLDKSIGITPYLKMYHRSDRPNTLARQLDISAKNSSGYEFGCSSRVKLTNELSASCTFQYISPTYDLQNRRYYNAIYICSLNQSFKSGLKLGISSTIPLKKDFTYSAVRSSGPDYHSNTKGQVHVSTFFIRLQASYQFKWGKQRAKIERQNRVEEGKQEKGF